MTTVPIDIILLMLMCLGGMAVIGLTGSIIVLLLGRTTSKVGRRVG